MPHSDIMEQISRIRAASRHFIIDELARRGVEDVVPSHGAVLACLQRAGGPVPVMSLVTALRRPKSTITKTTDSLESGGYLLKRNNPSDGRSYLVELTPMGRAFYSLFEDVATELEQKMFHGISPNDRCALTRLLGEVESNLD